MGAIRRKRAVRVICTAVTETERLTPHCEQGPESKVSQLGERAEARFPRRFAREAARVVITPRRVAFGGPGSSGLPPAPSASIQVSSEPPTATSRASRKGGQGPSITSKIVSCFIFDHRIVLRTRTKGRSSGCSCCWMEHRIVDRAWEAAGPRTEVAVCWSWGPGVVVQNLTVIA